MLNYFLLYFGLECLFLGLGDVGRFLVLPGEVGLCFLVGDFTVRLGDPNRFLVGDAIRLPSDAYKAFICDFAPSSVRGSFEK